MAPSIRPAKLATSCVAVVFTAVALLAAGCSTAAAPPGSSSPAAPAASTAPAPASDGDIDRITANLRAAISTHDMRLYREFRNQLSARVGSETVQGADAEYRQTLANLIAAKAAHDSKARAEFTARLRALCAPTSLTSAIEFCETDLAIYGG